MTDHLRLIKARNQLADGFKADGDELAGQLVNGVLTLVDWAKAFAQLIRHGVTSAFMLGKQTNNLDARATAIVSDLIGTQYGFAAGFVQDIATSITAGAPLSEPAVANRTGLYAGGSVVEPFERGNSDRFEITLPYYPTQDSPCMGNCRCAWSIVDSGDLIVATWIAQEDPKVCDVCQERADAAPIEFTRGIAA